MWIKSQQIRQYVWTICVIFAHLYAQTDIISLNLDLSSKYAAVANMYIIVV